MPDLSELMPYPTKSIYQMPVFNFIKSKAISSCSTYIAMLSIDGVFSLVHTFTTKTVFEVNLEEQDQDNEFLEVNFVSDSLIMITSEKDVRFFTL